MRKIRQVKILLTVIIILWCITIHPPAAAQTSSADSIQQVIAQLPDNTAEVNPLYKLSRIYVVETFDIVTFRTDALQQLTLSTLHNKKHQGAEEGMASAFVHTLLNGTYYKLTIGK